MYGWKEGKQKKEELLYRQIKGIFFPVVFLSENWSKLFKNKVNKNYFILEN